MAFEQGNQLWRKGLEARNEQKSKIDRFFEIVADGGIEKYGEKLEDLANGSELSKPEGEFFDRFEKLIPYVKPQLARTELTGKDGAEFKGLQVFIPTNGTASLEARAEANHSPSV